MMLFEMMTNKWLSWWGLQKYLEKFTDIQQFAFKEDYTGCLAFFLALGVGRKLTMGGLVDRELTLASGKQKEKSCCWEGLLIGEWCKECFVFLFWYLRDMSEYFRQFVIECFSMCVTNWHPNTVKTTLHSGQGHSPPTGDLGAVRSPQHSVEPREIVEQHPWRATTSKKCFVFRMWLGVSEAWLKCEGSAQYPVNLFLRRQG